MNQTQKLHESIGIIVELPTLTFLLVTGYVLFHAFTRMKDEMKENGDLE
jgi:hypothetical protein